MTGTSRFCEQCGSPLAEGVAFCESCGAAVPTAEAPAPAVATEPSPPPVPEAPPAPATALLQQFGVVPMTPAVMVGVPAGTALVGLSLGWPNLFGSPAAAA